MVVNCKMKLLGPFNQLNKMRNMSILDSQLEQVHAKYGSAARDYPHTSKNKNEALNLQGVF